MRRVICLEGLMLLFCTIGRHCLAMEKVFVICKAATRSKTGEFVISGVEGMNSLKPAAQNVSMGAFRIMDWG